MAWTPTFHSWGGKFRACRLVKRLRVRRYGYQTEYLSLMWTWKRLGVYPLRLCWISVELANGHTYYHLARHRQLSDNILPSSLPREWKRSHRQQLRTQPISLTLASTYLKSHSSPLSTRRDPMDYAVWVVLLPSNLPQTRRGKQPSRHGPILFHPLLALHLAPS